MPIKERIIYYFLAMGAQQITDQGQDRSGVSLLIGENRAHILILKAEDLAIRNAIIDAILNLSTLKNVYQLVYLAAPRILGATIDAAVFRARGIGLLFFDDRRIEETVTPQPSQPRPTVPALPSEDRAFAAELTTLKTMYLEMERNLTQLRDDLIRLRNGPPVREDQPQLLQPPKQPASQIFVQHPSQGEGLPSYFTNNPWLEVLSKRGNGGHEPIAA